MRKGLVCLALSLIYLTLFGASEKPEIVDKSPFSCDSPILKGEGGSDVRML